MRAALVVFLFLVALFLGAVGAGVYLAYNYPKTPHRPPGMPEGQSVKVVVKRGDNFQTVLGELVSKGVIGNPTAFKLYAMRRGLADAIRAGEYDVKVPVTPRELLNLLVTGVREREVRVTIPEGKHMLEVADILDAAGVAPKAALIERMRDPDLASRLGIRGDTLEGYLFPDTYRFRPRTSPERVLRVMHRRFRKVMGELRARHRPAMKKLERELRWGDHEVVILASIVEKETGRKHERPIIAGVYLNRLRLPSFPTRRMDADPTIIYGCTVLPEDQRSAACKQWDGRIRRRHLLDKENKYNTYQHPRLPPGPIANPGRGALEAVMAPQPSKYLFFVSKNDGTHVFSETREEHERWVDIYQRRRAPAPSR